MRAHQTQSRQELADLDASRRANALKDSIHVRSGKAGAAYGIIVFLTGFALGTLRILVIAPLLGAATALVLEVSMILVVSWFVSRWCATGFRIPREMRPRLTMAAVAFAVVVAADWGTAVFAFQEKTTQFLESYVTIAGLIGLCAQIAFACFPVFQARESEIG